MAWWLLQQGDTGLAEHEKIGTELRQELGDLITTFCWYADHGEAAKIPELFTLDGRISAPGMDVQGKADLTELFETRAKQAGRLSRHLWSNLRILSASPDRIEAVVTATTFIGTGDQPAMPETYVVGDSYETFEKGSDGHWRIAERRLDLAFKADS
ncbi:MAG: SnoaL-like domain-containing protein [Rhodospirillaceae bacterium]|nr:SnoaL-like domain-containing protein [Rhodospirillaceae bacterium]